MFMDPMMYQTKENCNEIFQNKIDEWNFENKINDIGELLGYD